MLTWKKNLVTRKYVIFNTAHNVHYRFAIRIEWIVGMSNSLMYWLHINVNSLNKYNKYVFENLPERASVELLGWWVALQMIGCCFKLTTRCSISMMSFPFSWFVCVMIRQKPSFLTSSFNFPLRSLACHLSRIDQPFHSDKHLQAGIINTKWIEISVQISFNVKTFWLNFSIKGTFCTIL